MMNSGLSVADIAAVSRNNDGFGDGNGWWVLILLFAICGGWGYGNGGFGGFGGGCYNNGPWATQSDVRSAVDQQTLISKIDGQTYGIADLGYALTNQFSQAELSRANQQAAIIAQMNNNAFSTQQGFSDIRYGQAADTCAITNAINQAVQTIMQNDNANYRQLHDENIAAQMAAKDAKIAELTAAYQQATWASSQAEQTNTIIRQVVDEIHPCAKPAYITCNPWAANNYCNGGGCCAA